MIRKTLGLGIFGIMILSASAFADGSGSRTCRAVEMTTQRGMDVLKKGAWVPAYYFHAVKGDKQYALTSVGKVPNGAGELNQVLEKTKDETSCMVVCSTSLARDEATHLVPHDLRGVLRLGSCTPADTQRLAEKGPSGLYYPAFATLVVAQSELDRRASENKRREEFSPVYEVQSAEWPHETYTFRGVDPAQ